MFSEGILLRGGSWQQLCSWVWKHTEAQGYKELSVGLLESLWLPPNLMLALRFELFPRFSKWETELHKVHGSVQIPLEVSAPQLQDHGLALLFSLLLFSTISSVFKCLRSAWQGWPVSWQKLSALRCHNHKEAPQPAPHACCPVNRWQLEFHWPKYTSA